MRKYRSAYYKPYIRRITNKDRQNTNCDFRTFLRLSFPEMKYVMVQRGCNNILAVGVSKQDLKTNILVVRSNKGFNMWANRIKHYCRKH